MNWIHFASPEFLYFLWTVPPLLLVICFGTLQKQKAYLRFYSDVNLVQTRRHKIQAVLLIASYLFLTIAIAQPQFGEKQVSVQQNLDIMLALDISTSMLAADVKPNRLLRAKQAIFSLLERLQGNRIGLLLFAESNFVVCPLTTDTTTLKEFLTAVTPNALVHSGTRIGNAIETATAHLNKKPDNNQIETGRPFYGKEGSGHKAVILWTDGEDHGETGLEAAETAARAGVHIYCIAIGNPAQPVPIPISEAVLQQKENGITYKRDVSGQLVITELNEELLRKLAKQGRGNYYHETEIEPLVRDLARLQKRTTQARANGHYADRFQFFAAAALILLLCEMLVPYQKEKRH